MNTLFRIAVVLQAASLLATASPVEDLQFLIGAQKAKFKVYSDRDFPQPQKDEVDAAHERVIRALKSNDVQLVDFIIQEIDKVEAYPDWFAGSSGTGSNKPEKTMLFQYFAYSKEFRVFADKKLEQSIYPPAHKALVGLLVYNYLYTDEAHNLVGKLSTIASNKQLPVSARIYAALTLGKSADTLTASFVTIDLSDYQKCQFDELGSTELSMYYLRKFFAEPGALKQWVTEENGSEGELISTCMYMLLQYGISGASDDETEAFIQNISREFSGKEKLQSQWGRYKGIFLGNTAQPMTLDEAQLGLTEIFRYPWRKAEDSLERSQKLQNYLNGLKESPERLRSLIDQALVSKVCRAQVFDRKRSLLAKLIRCYASDSAFIGWAKEFMSSPGQAEMAAYVVELYFCKMCSRSSDELWSMQLPLLFADDLQNSKIQFAAKLRLITLLTNPDRQSAVLLANGVGSIEPIIVSPNFSVFLVTDPELEIYASLSNGAGYLMNLDFSNWVSLLDERLVDLVLEKVTRSFERKGYSSSFVEMLPGKRDRKVKEPVPEKRSSGMEVITPEVSVSLEVPRVQNMRNIPPVQ